MVYRAYVLLIYQIITLRKFHQSLFQKRDVIATVSLINWKFYYKVCNNKIVSHIFELYFINLMLIKFRNVPFFQLKLIENPILCMDELSKLFALMEAQETRLLGIAHCIVPKEEEIPIIESIFVPPSVPLTTDEVDEEERPLSGLQPAILKVLMPIQPIKKTEDELQINSEKSVVITPSDVPSLILNSLMNSAAAAITEQSIKEIILTTTETSAPNIIAHTQQSFEQIESSVSSTVSDTVPLIIENATVYNKLENMTVLETTPSPNLKSFLPQTTETPEISIQSTSPNRSIAEIVLGEMESVSKSPEPDSNYIYETFSPISPAEDVSSLQRNEHLVLPEEPPEIPNVAAVPAA